MENNLNGKTSWTQKPLKSINKKAVIITEGGLTMGLGHVYRTLALAKELSKFGEVNFLTTSGKVVLNKVRNSGFKISKSKGEDELKKRLNLDNPDIIIIDKLEVDENFAKYIKTNLKARLIIFGNVSSANKYADVVINAIIGTDYKNKSFFDKNTGTLYLEGPKYLVLRREFYEHKNSYKFRDNLENILLIFGGSDQANLTTKVADKLLSMNDYFKISIILGPAFIFSKELLELFNKYKNIENRVHIYRNVNNVSELMTKADLVFTSTGTAMFESFLIGLPTIAFYQNLLQKRMFKGFIMTYDLDEINNFEDFMFSVYKNYYKNKKEIDGLDVGGGKNEIITNIIGGER